MFDRRKQGGSSDCNREGGRQEEEEGVVLPYRRLWGDISSPNLVEGTCREASHTYRGK